MDKRINGCCRQAFCNIMSLDIRFNGLDISGVEEMRKLFHEMKEEGKTFILVSHNREDINILCDEVYEMDSGLLSKIR